jgi:hypothetical protein
MAIAMIPPGGEVEVVVTTCQFQLDLLVQSSSGIVYGVLAPSIHWMLLLSGR